MYNKYIEAGYTHKTSTAMELADQGVSIDYVPVIYLIYIFDPMNFLTWLKIIEGMCFTNGISYQ